MEAFSFRPLWLEESTVYQLPDDLTLSLPSWAIQEGDLQKSDFEEKVAVARELGYNAFVFAAASGQPQKLTQNLTHKLLHSTLDRIRKKGMKVVLELKPASGDLEQFIQRLEHFRECVDYLFVTQGSLGSYGFRSSLYEPTANERTEEEIAYLARCLKLPIMYHICKQTDALLNFAFALKRGSLLSFTVPSENPNLPVFKELANMVTKTVTNIPHSPPTSNLVPLYESQQLPVGEGIYFPDFAFEEMEELVGRQRPHSLYGMGVKTKALSHFLSNCLLWVFGQRMLRAEHVQALFEEWLARGYPEWQPLFSRELVASIHAIFLKKGAGDIEGAARQLHLLAQAIQALKGQLRYKKPVASHQQFFEQISRLQIAVKAELEAYCQRKCQKIPLILQNFLPL